MTHRRTALVGLLALLSIAAAAVWFLPARWAMPWLAPRLNGLRLEEVSGLLWDGGAGKVISPHGDDLGRLTWQLSRRALLGDNRLHVHLQGARAELSGRMTGANAGDAHWTDVQMRVDLDLLGNSAALPMGRPRGVIEFSANDIQLHGGWPLRMDGQLRWHDAAVRTTRLGEFPLGTLHMTLQANNGVLEGHLQDGGDGPLRVDGQLQLSPLARRFTAEAAARQVDSPLQRWLSALGSTDARGITHINYSGGLAAAMAGEKR